MFWILVFGVIVLAVSLIITIAYLFVYIGYYTEVDVKTEPSKFRDKLIAYKEFDDDYDNIPLRYREVCEIYKDKVTFGIFENHDECYTEGPFKNTVNVISAQK